MSDPWGDVEDSPSSNPVNPVPAAPVRAANNQSDDDWEEQKGGSDWTTTNYDATARRAERRPRGSRGDRRGRNPRSTPGAAPDYERPQRFHSRGDRPRGDRFRPRFRGTRGREGGEVRHMAERTKIKKHRMFENNHNQTVIYREDEQQIDPNKLSTTSHFRADRNWDELPIPEPILQAIAEVGFVYPSKIQSFGIDVILQEGFENLIAQAPNGSGKTATFIIGSLCRVDVSDPHIQVICLSHTIELTNQIFAEYQKLASRIGVSVSLVSKDSKPTDLGQIVVTVAGSFLKVLRSKTMDLSKLKVFVVDEADHLFDSRNSPEFYNGCGHALRSGDIPDKTQFLLFSATFSDQIKTDIVKLLKEMNEITIKKEELMLDLIKHYYLRCDQREKISTFEQVLKRITRGITIAFVNTCEFAKNVCRRVEQAGHKTALLMGRDMTVDERNLTMLDFREGKYSVLVTTNLLARGIDNTKVSCVVNFDLPRVISTREMDYVLYLHRSGRCSRFGRNGICFNLITTDQELAELKTIEEYYNITINELPGIDNILEILTESFGKTEM
jgi:ATP-dependent RNA helicase DDX19/DBP5